MWKEDLRGKSVYKRYLRGQTTKCLTCAPYMNSDSNQPNFLGKTYLRQVGKSRLRLDDIKEFPLISLIIHDGYI